MKKKKNIHIHTSNQDLYVPMNSFSFTWSAGNTWISNKLFVSLFFLSFHIYWYHLSNSLGVFVCLTEVFLKDFFFVYLLMMSIITFHVLRRNRIVDRGYLSWLQKDFKNLFSITIIILMYRTGAYLDHPSMAYFSSLSDFFMFSRVFVFHRHTFWQFLLFKMHSIKHQYNSIALFSFLLILYESLVRSLFDFEHEIKRKKDVPFPSIDCDRSIDA